MTLKITRIDARGLNAEQTVAKLAGSTVPLGSFSLLSATAVVSEAGKRRTLEVFGEELTPHQVVERICQEVLATGLAAVLKYTEKLDKVKLQPEQIRVSAAELAAAHKQADPQFLTTVRKVRDNILEFQRAILHQDKEVRRPGVVLRQRYLPLDRVGCCVPGGAAAYPSTVLMTAVPAQAAGVKEIVIVAPPTPFGANNPDVLATCAELGISEVYRLGGAQAVAAMAYGLGTALPRVDKIVGPGNMFVTLAKKHVYGVVDIDSLAGPSEVVVIADDSTSAQFTAADMLAQAEHSPGSAVLVTWSEQLLDAVEAELTRQSATLSRCELT